MTERFRRGLVVGKFCPLHRGHELLIDRAQARCDELVVLSYTQPGFPGYGRERRARWLRSRFPQLACHVLDDEELVRRCDALGLARRTVPEDDAPDDVHRHFVAWLLQDLLGGPVDAVFTSEHYGDGFAAVLAEARGAPVRHVCVDLARTARPVSGTQVRRDPLAWRDQLSPEVYADLVADTATVPAADRVPRIALLGGESTGKTTLAAALARALGTVWVPEYGREWWDERGGRLQLPDMVHIARVQIEREGRQALAAHRCLVCDTTPLTTLLYSRFLFGHAEPELEAMAQRPYDLTLLCAADIPFVQDGTRRDDAFRALQQRRYEEVLANRGTRFHTVTGPLAQRVETAVALAEAAMAP